jgi:hypothetical protein
MLTRIVSGPTASLLARPVAHYINSQRDRLENVATALAECTKTKFSPYFPTADLDRVRIIECDPLPIPGFPFRNLAHYLGLDLPDISLVSAITFDHIIASRQPLVPTLLFHELVHAVHYRLLGVDCLCATLHAGIAIYGQLRRYYSGAVCDRT